MSFYTEVSSQLKLPSAIIDRYDDGTKGVNEVAHLELIDGRHVVQKVMLSNKKYHQRRKALTEFVMYQLDLQLGPGRVVPDLYVEMFRQIPSYAENWGIENAEGAKRVCQIVHGYAPGVPGDEWRGAMYSKFGNLSKADIYCKSRLSTLPDCERISLLDFITINQDRSARNWVTEFTEGAVQRFYAIDNGMAWFHEYPYSDDWKYGCAIDDVILQVGEWEFISGIFSTLWAGRPLSNNLLCHLQQFDKELFLNEIDKAAVRLGFPAGISQDWRFKALISRLEWIRDEKRQPSANEYRAWYKGSELFTPPEVVANGGKIIWQLAWDNDERLPTH